MFSYRAKGLIKQILFWLYFMILCNTTGMPRLKGLHEVLLFFFLCESRGTGLPARTETVQQLPLCWLLCTSAGEYFSKVTDRTAQRVGSSLRYSHKSVLLSTKRVVVVVVVVGPDTPNSAQTGSSSEFSVATRRECGKTYGFYQPTCWDITRLTATTNLWQTACPPVRN